MEMTECGAASLCMVLASYGCHVPLETMRVETGVSRDGCNMKGIKAAAQKYGLEVHVYRRRAEQLERTEVPAILHWNDNHFVVFEGFRGRHAWINDPAVGRRRLTRQALDEGFSGVVMTFRRTPAFRENRREHTVRDFVKRRLSGQRGALLQALATGALLLVPGLLLPVLAQALVDRGLAAGRWDWLGQLLCVMGGCALLGTALDVYRAQVLARLRARMILLSGKDFLSRLFRLPISFFEQRYTGDLVSRAMRNADVSRFLAQDCVDALLDAAAAALYLAILLAYSPPLTLLGGLRVLLCALGTLLCAGAVRDAEMKLQMSGGELHGALCAGLGITASIKAAGVEREYAGRMIGCQAKTAAFRQELMRRRQLLALLPEALGRIFDVLLLLAGGVLVIRGGMTPGMLVAYGLLFHAFCAHAEQLLAFARQLARLRAGVSRILDIERHELSAASQPQAALRPMTGKLSGHIELRDVAFGYGPLQPPVVEHLDVTLQSGEIVAFVGASGCGKSTVVKLVGGLYQPWSGEVRLDGVPRGEIPREVLCNSVATVSQDIHLFSGTIRDNLTLWDPTVLQADIDRAAQDAGIYERIMQLPGGYDFRLDEGARNLSGGERQRLELARALARKPSILILDEATSALDPLAEGQIMDSLRRRGCTCLLVTHRLHAIRTCSQIIVMKKGRIAERGTHAALMRAGGEYAALMRAEGERHHAGRKEAAGTC